MNEDSIADLNEVTLSGRLPVPADERALPSGDVLMTFRLVVRRPPGERGVVDSIECVSTRARVRRTVAACAAGDRLHVTGTLRRRFWRGAGGVQSRYAVDVRTVRRVRG